MAGPAWTPRASLPEERALPADQLAGAITLRVGLCCTETTAVTARSTGGWTRLRGARRRCAEPDGTGASTCGAAAGCALPTGWVSPGGVVAAVGGESLAGAGARAGAGAGAGAGALAAGRNLTGST